MNNNNVLRGEKVTAKPRKSKTYGEGRICEKNDCNQVMSKYNHNEFCFQHAPKRIPRTRGKLIR